MLSVVEVADLPKPSSNRTGWPWTESFEPDSPNMQSDAGDWPKISIITPSYNSERFFEETIRSVILQGYPNLEYVIVDGDSKDGTLEIIEKYAPWIGNWVSEPDDGHTDAVNKGFEMASGEIFGWLATDDTYLPGTLWQVATEYRRANFVAFAGGIVHVDGDGNKTGSKGGQSFDPELIMTGLKPGCPASFYRHDILELVGDVRVDLGYNPDREFFLRIGDKFWPELARTTDEPFSTFRSWGENITDSGGDAAIQERIDVVDEFLSKAENGRYPANVRRRALYRIYDQQISRERAQGNFYGEVRYRFLAARKQPSFSRIVKAMIRSLQLVVRVPWSKLSRTSH
jgi:glycosyltransferase involved in cell wall biosynthesis